MKHIISIPPATARLWITFGEEERAADYRLKCIIRSAIQATLRYEEFFLEASISVTFTGNESMRELNRTYRGKDATTDVLSFPQFERGEPIYADKPPVLLGDIVLNLERAREQAEELGNTFEREVAFLCIHSTLHLLGYDHELSSEDDKDMCERQKAIVATLPLHTLKK